MTTQRLRRWMRMAIAATAVSTSLAALAETPPERVLDAFELQPRSDFRPEAGLTGALETALGRSPGLEAARQRWAAAHHLIAGSRALPDPVIGVTSFLEPVETRVGPQERVFSLRQTLPLFGKRDLRGRAQAARAAAVGESVAAEVLALLTEVREAWYEAAWLQEASRLATRRLQLQQQQQAVALSNYESGRGDFASVLRAQMEEARVEIRISELCDRRSAALERLAASLDVDTAEVAIAPIAMPPLDGLPSADALASQVAHLAAAANPGMLALERETAALIEEDRLAGRTRYPDLTFGVDWIQVGPARMEGVDGGGDDAVAARVSFNLPLWGGRVRAQRQESAARLRAAKESTAQFEADLRARTRVLQADYADAQRRLALHEHNLLPRGRQLAATVSSAYEAGTTSFAELVSTHSALLEIETAAGRARADQLIALARLEAVLGRPLTADGRIEE